jgi:uncharacterized protein (TIGR00725 family)
MGSGAQPHEDRAQQLGSLLADLGVNLLTGGGGGVMESVSRAFAAHPDRQGVVIGVLPSAPGDELCRPRPGYPNRWVEIAIATHLPFSGMSGQEPLSRNHINVLTSQAIVVLPGGSGTASEAKLALRYEKPILAFLDPAEMPQLPAEIAATTRIEEVGDFLERALRANGAS